MKKIHCIGHGCPEKMQCERHWDYLAGGQADEKLRAPFEKHQGKFIFCDKFEKVKANGNRQEKDH